MGFDQKGTLVFCVSSLDNRKWNVFEQGFDKALASFDSREDACDYAEDLAKHKAGSKVLIQDHSADPPNVL